LVYHSALLFPSLYTIVFWEFYFLPLSVHAQTNTYNSIFSHSLYMPKPTHTILFSPTLYTCPNQRNLYNLTVSIIMGLLTNA
jgi:hypothetical protein